MAILILTQSEVSRANSILIKSPQTSEEEYLGALNGLPQHQDYISYSIQNINSPLLNKEISNNFLLAQKEYFDANFKEAQRLFTMVVSHYAKGVWDKTYINIFTYSYLRLYQIDFSDPLKWLKQASLIFQTNKTFKKSFSPDLIQRLMSLKKSELNIIWMPYKNLNMFEKIYINGELYRNEIDLKIKISQGLNHIILFSNSFQKIDIEMAGDKLLSWTPRLEPLITGNCENPFFLKKGAHFSALFPGHCLKSSKTPPIQANLSHFKPATHIEPSSKDDFPFQQLTSAPTSKVKKWYNNTWLWTGAIILVGGWLYVANQNKEDRIIPTHSEK